MQSARRQRDADRTQSLIVDAAEGVFAEKGYAATTMQEIAARAGVARATPGYFFGSKDALYEVVLRRVHAERAEALIAACAPIHDWASDPRVGYEELEVAVASAVRGYLAFLERRTAFARLIEWEALAAVGRLPGDLSGSFSEAFRALHRVRRRRGLRDFDVTVVVVALVSMCFLPVAHASTFIAGGGIDPLEPAFRRRYERQVVCSVLAMLVDESGPRRN